MINSVRNTVQAIANKENFGYIPPIDFNLYAKQAQLSLFEDYFYRYNQWVYRQNARMSGSGSADVVKKMNEVIEIFTVPNASLTLDTGSTYNLPDNFYLSNLIMYGNKEIEKVSNYRILMLNSSNLTAPTVGMPAYTKSSNQITVYPTTITSGVTATYVRFPSDPKWTYQELSGGEPLFDQGNPDYNDFELPLTDIVPLITKILQYVGVSIREPGVVNFMKAEEQKEDIQEG